jgi:hypothetical protein
VIRAVVCMVPVMSLQGLTMHDVCQGDSVGSSLFSGSMTRCDDEALAAKRDREERRSQEGVQSSMELGIAREKRSTS